MRPARFTIRARTWFAVTVIALAVWCLVGFGLFAILVRVA